LILNLYFLDILRDGVLNPAKPQVVDSSVARADNRSGNEYPEMFELVELSSRIDLPQSTTQRGADEEEKEKVDEER
jgi:hypothetical protein